MLVLVVLVGVVFAYNSCYQGGLGMYSLPSI